MGIGNLGGLELLLLLLVPIFSVAGFLLSVRAGCSRGKALLSAIGGAVVPSLLLFLFMAVMGDGLGEVLALPLALMIFSAIVGFWVGVIGLLVRALRPWLSKRV